MSKLTDRLRDRYADASIVVRAKLTGVFMLLVVISALMPVIVVSDIFLGDYLNAGIELVIEAIMIIAIFRLFKGNYRFASVAPLVVTVLAVSGLALLQSPENANQVYTVTTYMIAPVVLSLAVSETEWHTTAVSAVGLIVILVATFAVIRPGLPPEEVARLGEDGLIALVIYLLIGVFGYRVGRTMRTSLSAMEEVNRRNTDTIRRIHSVVSQAASSADAARSVQRYFSDVDSKVSAIRGHAGAFSERTLALSASIQNALEAVARTSERVSGFHSQVDEQNSVVEESTAAVNEMSASLDSVAQITADKRSATEALLHIAEAGLNELEMSNDAFQRVSKEMQSLFEINSIVGNIASQTNMLSMNAAIEAAHAGDSGKGFAVVAEEIRKLASSTADNSRIINENLTKIMNSMEQTTEHASRITARMTEIVTEIRQVSAAFAEITGSTSELSQGGREILSGMQVLSNSSLAVRDGSNQISSEQENAKHEMEEVGKAIGEIESATREILDAVNGIGSAMGELNETIKQASDQSTQLQSSVGELTDLG